MALDRIVEDYRGHKLLAALYRGSHKGRVWGPDGILLNEVNGTSNNELIIALRNYVDATIVDRANSRQGLPEVAEYVRAFQKIIKEGLPDSHFAMLKAHYRAKNRTMTATQLAKAGNYKNWSSANLQYGILGKRVYEQVPTQLIPNADGTFVYTSVLATEGERTKDESQWQWIMKPEVAQAIEQLGLQN
jgi:hypothetical protein